MLPVAIMPELKKLKEFEVEPKGLLKRGAVARRRLRCERKTFYSHIFVKTMLYKAFSILIIMELGDNVTLIRKKKGLSQADLGKLIGTSNDVIGRYGIGDINPSIDVVTNIAEALEVSLDYLVGKTKIVMDKETVDRLKDCKAPRRKKELRTWHY